MSTVTAIAIALIVGVVAGVYLPMNGKLGQQIGSPLLATAVFFVVGAAAAVVAWLAVGRGDTFGALSQGNPWLFGLGLVSFSIILSATFLIPIIGPGAYFVCMVAGQVAVGLVLSHFGWFSPEPLPLTPLKAVGALAVIGGVACIYFAERNYREVGAVTEVNAVGSRSSDGVKLVNSQLPAGKAAQPERGEQSLVADTR
ncbi:MAG: DMT family transporter [Pseudomonadota bacterium]